MQTPQVLIYQDYIHNNGPLFTALTRHFGHGAVGYCDDADILAGCLTPGIRLFVMPGGADLYYCEKLDGAGNALIKSYVEQGGSYLGICAGAYYACAALDWGKDTGQHIHGPRQLGFYDGISIGPLPDFIEDGDIEKSWKNAAPLYYDDGQIRFDTHVLYDGGPVFENGTGKILAAYPGNRAAIVECAVGNGLAILSSPHIEIMTPPLYAHRNNSFRHEQAVSAALAPHLEMRQELWSAVLNRLTRAQEGRDENAA